VKRAIQASLLIAVAACAAAQADTVHVFSGSLGGTSDFVFRGISLTRGKPALQASADVEFPQEFYVGAFVATADPNPGPSAPVELDAWAGRYWQVSDQVSADLRLAQYTYPNDPRLVSYNRSEVSATLGYRNQLFVAASYSPNMGAVGTAPGYREGSAWAFELSARQPINERFSLAAGFGHYALENVYADSYNYWNATLTANLAPFELQLAYLGVDSAAARHFRADSVGDRLALTALWRFSSTK